MPKDIIIGAPLLGDQTARGLLNALKFTAGGQWSYTLATGVPHFAQVVDWSTATADFTVYGEDMDESQCSMGGEPLPVPAWIGLTYGVIGWKQQIFTSAAEVQIPGEVASEYKTAWVAVPGAKKEHLANDRKPIFSAFVDADAAYAEAARLAAIVALAPYPCVISDYAVLSEVKPFQVGDVLWRHAPGGRGKLLVLGYRTGERRRISGLMLPAAT